MPDRFEADSKEKDLKIKSVQSTDDPMLAICISKYSRELKLVHSYSQWLWGRLPKKRTTGMAGEIRRQSEEGSSLHQTEEKLGLSRQEKRYLLTLFLPPPHPLVFFTVLK